MASALATTATAAELQSWPQNKPVSLTPGGHDIQVVNVWATWCAPCRKEMPLLSRWYVKQQQSRAKPKVSMLGVALDSEANIARFVPQLQHLPRYVTTAERGDGFVQLADKILERENS